MLILVCYLDIEYISFLFIPFINIIWYFLIENRTHKSLHITNMVVMVTSKKHAHVEYRTTLSDMIKLAGGDKNDDTNGDYK